MGGAILSIIVLTHQEEMNLPHLLESIRGLDAELFVVDSGSTDETRAIASSFGAHVVEHPFENHAAQLNWALKSLPVKTPWVMRLDADERVTPELVDELHRLLPNISNNVAGLMMKRRVYFWGKWIRYGGYYPTWLLRVWRNGSAVCEQRWMDEHMVISAGDIAELKNDIIDENQKGLSFWIEKHNRYADREVLDMTGGHTTGEHEVLSGQVRRKRWLKQNLYARSPLFFRCALYWFYRYVILLGFLDGRAGLVFHFLQAFWYRFLVDAKYLEVQLNKAKKPKTEPSDLSCIPPRPSSGQSNRTASLQARKV